MTPSTCTNIVNLVPFIAIWYVTNIFATYFSKKLFSSPSNSEQKEGILEWGYQTQMAMWLSFAQLFLSGTIGFLYVQFRENSTYRNGGFFSYLREAREKNDPAYKKIMLTAVFNAIGSTCVNMAYIKGSVSLVQIIKSLEPVTTFVLSAGILKMKCSIPLFVSIIFVVMGSVVTFCSDSSHNRNSFLLAFTSNLMMPLRNVLMKSAADSSSHTLENQQPTGFMMFSLISALGSSLVGAITVTTSLITGTGHILADTMVWNRIFLSSGFFFAYNGSSFVVLNKADAITHSVLNIVKRYFNILCNVALFSTDFTTQTATGLLISAVGLLMFTMVKMKLYVPLPAKKSNAHHILCISLYSSILLMCVFQFYFHPSKYLDVKVETAKEFGDQVNLRMMVIPFDAYVMRNQIMEHRTCKRTIMVRSLHDWEHQPFTEYHDNIKDLPLEANKSLVCISVGSKTGAIILFHSNLNLDDDLTFLGPSATELVVELLEHSLKKSRVDLQVEIVKHTTVAMLGWYQPTSPKVVENRQKDGNTGNFIWQYGATRMINPHTTSFIDADNYEATSEASALVLASANAFYMDLENEKNYNRMKSHVEYLTGKTRKIDKPTILLGIGIQANFNEVEDISTIKLHEHQAALLKEIDLRNNATTSVSVRGDVTHTAAVNAGVTNTISLGCPR